MSEKVYRKDEPLFVASRYPQLSLVLDAGGSVALGGRIVTQKPRYIDFHPHPAVGGIFRATKAAAKRLKLTQEELVAALRERDAIDDHYIEVTSDEHFLELAALRSTVVKDDADRPVIRGGVKRDSAGPEPRVSEPPVKTQGAPPAAKGPGLVNA